LGAGYNVQETLAFGVAGGGAALVAKALGHLFQKREQPPTLEVNAKPRPLMAFLFLLLGLALVGAGIAWYIASR
jgi:hypothetical protein